MRLTDKAILGWEEQNNRIVYQRLACALFTTVLSEAIGTLCVTRGRDVAIVVRRFIFNASVLVALSHQTLLGLLTKSIWGCCPLIIPLFYEQN